MGRTRIFALAASALVLVGGLVGRDAPAYAAPPTNYEVRVMLRCTHGVKDQSVTITPVFEGGGTTFTGDVINCHQNAVLTYGSPLVAIRYQFSGVLLACAGPADLEIPGRAECTDRVLTVR